MSTAHALGANGISSTGRHPVSVSVASWLGVLFVMLFVLNTVGGWVRLSGAGVAIPQWPIINGSLLPPLNETGWEAVKGHYDQDQQRLRERVLSGELHHVNVGYSPKDMTEFKSMFMTEWSHRFLSALVGIMAAGCLTIIWRRAPMRALVAWPMSIAGFLIIIQALVGGMLVREGTNTNWLFLHQANASLIMACVLISIVRILSDGVERPSVADKKNRRSLNIFIPFATVIVWAQLVVGSLVAGSRNERTFEPWSLLSAGRLWDEHQSWWWNFQSNAELHQWLHRWMAWSIVVLIVIIALFAWRKRHDLPQRLRLGLQSVMAFLIAQVVLGLGNVWTGITPLGSLAHQFMGMCLFLGLVLCWFDARNERNQSAPKAAPQRAQAVPT
jgi:heme a synthase